MTNPSCCPNFWRALVWFLICYSCVKAEVEEALSVNYPVPIQTCQGECGMARSAPCSCGARCFVLRNCCTNITQDCPGVVEEATYKYGPLIGAPVSCQKLGDKVGVIMINSCPSTSLTGSVSGEQLVGLYRGDQPENVNTTQRISTPSDSGTHTTDNMMPVLSAWRLKFEEAFRAAPVTELTTGITFTNMSVYECYVQHLNITSSISKWSLRTGVGYGQHNPVSLDEIETFLKEARPEPLFDTDLLHGSMCRSDVVEDCRSEREMWTVEDEIRRNQCLQSDTSLVVSKPNGVYYINSFCFLCNEGEEAEVNLVNNVDTFTTDYPFSILLQLSPSGDIDIFMEKGESLLLYKESSWTKTQCRINHVEETAKVPSTNPISCAPTCKLGHVERPDGICRSINKVMIALPDTFGLGQLCSDILQTLPHFLYCALESWSTALMVDSDAFQDLTIHSDANTGTTMFVAEVEFYSSTDRIEKPMSRYDVVSRMVGLLSLAIQAFHKSCKKDTNKRNGDSVTPQILTVENNKRFNNITVSPVSQSLMDSIEFQHNMRAMRGERVLNGSSTVVCYSREPYTPSSVAVVCIEDDARLEDVDLVNVLLNSTCLHTFIGGLRQGLSLGLNNDVMSLIPSIPNALVTVLIFLFTSNVL